MIPYGRQDIRDEDIDAVVEVLRSDYITQGPVIERFERQVADRVGARYAIAVNSATSALHIACLALGLGPGDRLWTTPVTFVASANCARYCGAEVDFVDIDQNTYNLCMVRLREKLQQAERNGTLPKVVVAVHLAGQSCDMVELNGLRQQYGFRVIEDASHAIGGQYQNRPIGNCQYSDATVFSFHPVKIVTTGEGGMVLTNDSALAEQAELLRSHGITRAPEHMNEEPHGPWYYEQIALGFNYRITDIQAALGVSQLDRLDDYLAQRSARVERYNSAFASLPIRRPWQLPSAQSAWHLYIIRLINSNHQTHRRFFEHLRTSGIGVNVHYIPVHLQPYYRRLGFNPGDFPVAEAYYREAVSLPLYPTLSSTEQDSVIESVVSGLEAIS
ncbi:MAG: UDP-4-amino-4,6-dideoxy-N-acetyl-beta-L-altrosamine transaminase [Saccharospirillum sp.]